MYKTLVTTAAAAKEKLNNDACTSIIEFLQSMQNPDGGFQGRSAQSDIYYSMFATLASLALTATIPKGITEYTNSFKDGRDLDLIHLCALARLYACNPDIDISDKTKIKILKQISEYQSHDKGYNHLAKFADSTTPYGIFLAGSAYKELKMEIPAHCKLIEGIQSCRTPDSGFSNNSDSKTGTTNATAAALAFLSSLMQEEGRAKPFSKKNNLGSAAEFLLSMAFPKGGFKASKNAPLPDILSTATVLFALKQINHPIQTTVKEKTFSMIEDHWASSGGFFGNQGEAYPDCEYTFYALLAIGSIVTASNLLNT